MSGYQGMHWQGLVHFLFEERCGPPPDILLVYLGENDLSLMKGKVLVLHAKTDLQLIKGRWLEIIIIWSAIILFGLVESRGP